MTSRVPDPRLSRLTSPAGSSRSVHCRAAAALFTLLWLLGWALWSATLLLSSGTEDSSPLGMLQILVLLPMVAIGVGFVVAWAMVIRQRAMDRRCTALAAGLLVVSAALLVLGWADAYAWGTPSVAADPASPTGFSEPSWTATNRAALIALGQTASAIALLIVLRSAVLRSAVLRRTVVPRTTPTR